jgi:hypothetical protein
VPILTISAPPPLIRWIVALMAALAGVVVTAEPGESVHQAQPSLLTPSFLAAVQTGDLVLRRGRSLVSRAVLLSDVRGAYSHVGVALRRGDSVWVVHVAPATQTDRGMVVREPLAVYLGADRAAAAGLYRSDALAGAMRDSLEAVLRDYARRRLPFDDDFDLDTPARLYCTELVWLAYRHAGLELLPNGAPNRATPLGTRRYVYPSDLAHSPHMRPVANLEQSPDT